MSTQKNKKAYISQAKCRRKKALISLMIAADEWVKADNFCRKTLKKYS